MTEVNYALTIQALRAKLKRQQDTMEATRQMITALEILQSKAPK